MSKCVARFRFPVRYVTVSFLEDPGLVSDLICSQGDIRNLHLPVSAPGFSPATLTCGLPELRGWIRRSGPFGAVGVFPSEGSGASGMPDSGLLRASPGMSGPLGVCGGPCWITGGGGAPGRGGAILGGPFSSAPA